MSNIPDERDLSRSPFRENNLQAHIEDSLIVYVLRDRRVVAVHWNTLSESERWAAYDRSTFEQFVYWK